METGFRISPFTFLSTAKTLRSLDAYFTSGGGTVLLILHSYTKVPSQRLRLK